MTYLVISVLGWAGAIVAGYMLRGLIQGAPGATPPLAVPSGFSFATAERDDAEPLAKFTVELLDGGRVGVEWDCSEDISPLKVIPMAMQMYQAAGEVLFLTLREAARENAQNN